jgi:hypothetical protein
MTQQLHELTLNLEKTMAAMKEEMRALRAVHAEVVTLLLDATWLPWRASGSS